ncbi:hypothetical protein GCM10022221_45730 [Actinocorallia aurea]
MKKSTLAVAAAVAVQAALAVWAVFPQLSAFATGTETRLAVTPVDPIDPFRGAYVALDYPDLPDKTDGPAGAVHVPLLRDGVLWKGGAPTRTRPRAPYLACTSPGDGQLDCGLDTFFVSEDRARRLEQDLSDGRLTAVVRVASDGQGVIVRLEPLPSP